MLQEVEQKLVTVVQVWHTCSQNITRLNVRNKSLNTNIILQKGKQSTPYCFSEGPDLWGHTILGNGNFYWKFLQGTDFFLTIWTIPHLRPNKNKNTLLKYVVKITSSAKIECNLIASMRVQRVPGHHEHSQIEKCLVLFVHTNIPLVSSLSYITH